MTKDFEMIEVESSSIEAIGWKENELRVRFKDKKSGKKKGGALYGYTPFSFLAWTDFKKAESTGKFFFANIRHNKEITCTKIKEKDNVDSNS